VEKSGDEKWDQKGYGLQNRYDLLAQVSHPQFLSKSFKCRRPVTLLACETKGFLGVLGCET